MNVDEKCQSESVKGTTGESGLGEGGLFGW